MIRLLLFLLVIPCLVQAQSFELVRPADFRYYVTVNGDTVASRSLDYKAIQDAVYYQCQNPSALVRVEPVGVEARGCPIPEPEVIYIDEGDYVTEIVKQYNHDYSEVDSLGYTWPETVRDFNLEIRQIAEDTTGTYTMVVEGTTSADYVRVATNCYGYDPSGILINERRSGQADTLADGTARWERTNLLCRGIMTYWISNPDGEFSVWFADIGQILSLD